MNCTDPKGEFAVSTLALVGISISAIVGGLCAGLGTASSGGSTGEIVTSAVIGAATAGCVATVAAYGAVTSMAYGAMAAISAGIGASGEALSIVTEHAFHKNDADYSFSWGNALVRVGYAAGISALSGVASLGLNKLYEAEEFVYLAISAETAVACGAVDFGVRQIISCITKAPIKQQPQMVLAM